MSWFRVLLCTPKDDRLGSVVEDPSLLDAAIDEAGDVIAIYERALRQIAPRNLHAEKALDDALARMDRSKGRRR